MVLDDDLSVDARETETLRSRMAAERGDVALFDTGGTVEELKARCKADTSLDPPRQPVFQKWMQAQPMKLAAE